MLGHRVNRWKWTMRLSDTRPSTHKGAPLNGAREVVSSPKRAWAAECALADGQCHLAGAWMRTLQAVP